MADIHVGHSCSQGVLFAPTSCVATCFLKGWFEVHAKISVMHGPSPPPYHHNDVNFLKVVWKCPLRQLALSSTGLVENSQGFYVHRTDGKFYFSPCDI